MKSIKLYKKYKNTKNDLILFCICQLYLIENNVRNIAQIEFNESEDSQYELYDFLHENHIPFLKRDGYGIVIGKNLNKKDLENHVNFAKELGAFYKCSSNTYHKNHYRVVIECHVNGFVLEVFAQMCTKEVLQKNMTFLYKFFNKITNLFHKLDINVELNIHKDFKENVNVKETSCILS